MTEATGIAQETAVAEEMASVVERLRASKEESDKDSLAAGKELGAAWAKGTADTVELQRLDNLPTFHGVGFFQIFARSTHSPSSSYSLSELLYFVMHSEDEGNRDAAGEFWECVLGSEADLYLLDDVAWMRGFVDGAQAL